jgi:branched-chain amino acid transport system substrate-binding protein
VADFRKRYNRPPENQAWGDYNAMKLTAQAMADTKSLDSTKLVEHFEKGAKFGIMKTREGYFRKADHQMMHEMYTVEALPAAQIRNEWDIFVPSAAVPGPNESLEVIATQGEEIECKMV